MSLLQLTRQFAFRHWIWYVQGFIALATTTWITITIPSLSKNIINDIKDLQIKDSASDLALLIIGLGCLQMLIRALSRILFFWPGRKIESEIKDHYFQKILFFPVGFFNKLGMGELISRLSNDVGQIRVFFAFAFLQFCNFFLLLVFAIYKMYSVNAILTVAALSPLILMIICTRFGMPIMHKFSTQAQEALGKLTNEATETFSNISVIHNHCAYEPFLKRIESKNKQVFWANMKLVLIRTVIFPLASFLTGIAYLIVLSVGGYLVIQTQLTIGDLLAFNIYISLLAFPLTAMGFILSIYQRANSAATRLNVLNHQEIEQATLPPTVSQSTEAKNLLSFKNLYFTYPENPTNSLSSINFDVYEGDSIGIVGEIGSGKTTLLNLAAYLYSPPKGTLYYCGKDINSIHPEEYRKSIGFGQQNPYLFSSTIHENISLGRTNASRKEIEMATMKSSVFQDIQRFPQEFETKVGEKGVRLSGGQKQRIALSRIFLKNPQIWLLDDITSAIDHETEGKILHEIFKHNPTLIISSHRSSTLRHCDRIIVLDKGKQIDCCTYPELISSYQYLLSSDDEESGLEIGA